MGNYLWHRSQSDCCVIAGQNATGEFLRIGHTPEGGYTFTPTGVFFLQANLFTFNAPAYGEEFWLFPGQNGTYSVDDYSEQDPNIAGAVKIPWGHIVQHMYSHLSSFAIKEAHTFWPAGTTEAAVLADLVAALNNHGTSPTTGASIAWNGNEIKTFFLRRTNNPQDRYTPDQLSDLNDLFS